MKFDGDQLRSINAMKNGDNVFITGEGGSGKSTVVRHFLKQRTGMDVAILAPTGIAALNINGMTIHRFFKFNLETNFYTIKSHFEHVVSLPRIMRKKRDQEVVSLVRSIRVLGIDEIGMVRSDVLNAVDDVCRAILDETLPFGGLQVILTGDPYQLPPVVTDKDRLIIPEGQEWFFNSRAFIAGGFKVFTLKKSHRINSENDSAESFKEALNSCRLGNPEQHHIDLLNTRAGIPPSENAIHLVTTNKMASEVNKRELDLIPEPESVYRAWKSGDVSFFDFPIEIELVLKPGARVIFTVNDPDNRWVNGTLGTVVDCGEKMVVIDIDGHGVEEVTKHKFEQKDWASVRAFFDEDDEEVPDESEMMLETVGEVVQFPIRLAWAITIHKSQGKTLENGHINGINGFFAPGQPYVAVSRMVSLEGVTLSCPLNKEDFFICPYVEQFMNQVAA